MKRVDDRGGTTGSTKVEAATSVYPATRMVATDITNPAQGVTVTGQASFPARVLPHGVPVYRDGTTLTPAPAHAGQPSTVIHQFSTGATNKGDTPVSLQFSRALVSAGNSITVAVTSPSGSQGMQLHNPAPAHIVHKGSTVAFGPTGGANPQANLRSLPPGMSTGNNTTSTSSAPSFQRLKVEDALSYLDQVKFKFGNQPQVYNDFLDIMKEFKSQSIDTPGVISRVSMLFKGHPELIVGFNTFLPPGYKIEVQTNEGASQAASLAGHPHLAPPYFQTIVHTPHGTHMMGAQGVIGPAVTSSSLLPTAQVVRAPMPAHHTQQPPTKYHVKTINESVAVATPINNSQQHSTTVAGSRNSAVDQLAAIVTTSFNSNSGAGSGVVGPPQHHHVHQQPLHGQPTTIITAGSAAGGPTAAHLHSVAPLTGGTPAINIPAAAASSQSSAATIVPIPQLPVSASLGPASAATAAGSVQLPWLRPAGESAGNAAAPPVAAGTPLAALGGAAAGQQPVEFNHAINYVNKIKNRFQGQPDVYKQFLEILHTYQKDQRAVKEGSATKTTLTESEVYSQVSKLFEHQSDLLLEFGQFLPEAISDNSTEAVIVSSKGLVNDHAASGKRIAVPAKPTVLPPKMSTSSGSLAAAAAAASASSIPNSQQQPPMQPQQLTHSTAFMSPHHQQHQGVSAVHLNNNSDSYNNSMSGVGGLPAHGGAVRIGGSTGSSQGGSAINSGSGAASVTLMPSSNTVGGASSGLNSSTSVAPTAVGGSGDNSSSPQQSSASLKRPAATAHHLTGGSGGTGGAPGISPRMQPPSKKSRIGGSSSSVNLAVSSSILKDVSLSEAAKFGTLNEYAFFDKVRKALKNSEVYENFLRCLVLFNQEVISRNELVMLCTPFLNKHAELLKWFKDFVGFKDNMSSEAGQPSSVPAVQPTPRTDRLTGDSAMEIDYASCKRLGASYCALPKNFVQPKCSGRGTGNTLCKEVLNDTWVSFPSWSEDSQFVSSRKTQYEEHIYRTEDERFEYDVVLETNRDTIKVLECVQKKMSRMPPEEAARYRLDDCLGGTSATIHQRAIRRIYGDKAVDIIDGLKRNPVVAVPLVLRRLKAKDAEWREVQKQFNKNWREQNEKYYLKSLDHQGMLFKQNDVRFLRSKSLLNEIETLYDEAHEADDQTAGNSGGSPAAGLPHLTLTYGDKSLLDDATQLLIHHVKRQTTIHKEDKQKIKQLLRQNLPDMFFHQRQEMSEGEDEDDNDNEDEDNEDNDEDEVKKDSKSKIKDKANVAAQIKEEELREEIRENKVPPQAKNQPDDEEYTLFMGNNNWYLFLRMHQILCERLGKIFEQSVAIANDDDGGNEGRESAATALRLKPKSMLNPPDYYPAFLDMIRNFLDGNMEPLSYEDTLREMFGIHAYIAFTLDKLIANAVRQLQQLVCDDTCQDCWELYQSEKKAGGTGGCVSLAEGRYYQELLYQKKAEKLLTDENCFKTVIYRDSGILTFELIDTESESRNGSDVEAEENGAGGGSSGGSGGDATPSSSSGPSAPAAAPNAGGTDDSGAGRQRQQQSNGGRPAYYDTYLERFLARDSTYLSPDALTHLTKHPAFLCRSVRHYRKHTRHKIVPRRVPPPSTDTDNNPKNDNAQSAKTARNEKCRLALDDAAILIDEGNSECSLASGNLRLVWVINSEHLVYKGNSLNRALQNHARVSKIKYKRFCAWYQAWTAKHITDGMAAAHNDWMLGRVLLPAGVQQAPPAGDGTPGGTSGAAAANGTVRTHRLTISNLNQAPYRTFTRYRATPEVKAGAGGSSSSSAVSAAKGASSGPA